MIYPSKLTRNVCCALAGAAILTMCMPTSEACFSVLAGKNATVSGKVLLGHNEDNGGRQVGVLHKVERMRHADGEMIRLENNQAVIPQVRETLGYYWSELRSPQGISFCDYFMNERGVAITSDSCLNSREDKPDLKDGGIGYGVRKIVAERATSARHAVEIAIDLIETYGYSASGRSYQFADKNEGWMLQVVNGKQYVAKRVADHEIALIPNHYTIRAVDMKDKNNYIVSPTLISYAIERGWYTPKKTGDYSDFDFAKAYQAPSIYEDAFNTYRHQHAVEILTKKPYTADQYPFSVVLDRKIDKNDVKSVLTSHYEGTKDDLSTDTISPHFTNKRTICASTTQESSIVEFNDNNDLNIVWRANGHPCTSPYIPWFVGIQNMPKSAAWLPATSAFKTHFSAPVEDYDYNASRAYWTYQDMENILDPQYKEKAPQVKRALKDLESSWEKEMPAILEKAQQMYAQSPEKARLYITEYSSNAALSAEKRVKELYGNLANVKIAIDKKELNGKIANQQVNVTIFSNAQWNAKEIDTATLQFGFAYISPENRAKAISFKWKDVNQDGRTDLVATFDVQQVLAPKYDGDGDIQSIPSSYSDIWLTATTKQKNPIVAEAFVTVKN